MRIVKLGGSLLTVSDWPDAVRRWLGGQPPKRTMLIIGGGAAADAVREWDSAHRLDPSDAHWLAIDAMCLTARLAARLLPEVEWTDDWQVVAHSDAPTRASVVVFDPRCFLRDIEPTAGGKALPESWDATSDSIAARIAELLGCEELVLLKSCLPAAGVEALDQAAETQLVDRCFPEFAAKLPLVRLVNLRDGGFPERRFERSKVVPLLGGCH